ncbi:MAG: type II toxin-antitoxin system RelE/ParE family toxin [Armatimonadetes bacterium]|nr:type II toxin-antitoxin system RelE/ParE family toxin [Armatimonadota bacterium]
MTYRLLYHPAVARDDLAAISPEVRERIARAVETRLCTAPERYGVPLRGTLKGYWKLRVGDHRAIYRVVGDEIWILAIRHRRDMYGEVRDLVTRALERQGSLAPPGSCMLPWRR